MKGIISAFVLLLIASTVACNLYERNQRPEVQVEAQRKERDIRKSVEGFAESRNAIVNWPQKLVKEGRTRVEPILTIELEQLWVGDKPILFEGNIKDISSHDKTHYKLLLESGLLSNGCMFTDTRLQLELMADIETVDTFLSNHKNLRFGEQIMNQIAVVAAIQSIQREEYINSEGVPMEIKIGIGQLIDIKFLSDIHY